MSSGNTHSNKRFEVTPELKKRWGRMEALDRYEAKKHEVEKARPESIAKASEARCKADASFREMHHRRKFHKKYRAAKYLDYYVPLLNKFGYDLAGVKIHVPDEDFYMEGDDTPPWYSLGAHMDCSLDSSTRPPSSISLSHTPNVPASAHPTVAARGLPTASSSASTNRAAAPAAASLSAASTQQHGFYVIERTRVLHNDRAAAMAMAGGNSFCIFLQLVNVIEAAVIQARFTGVARVHSLISRATGLIFSDAQSAFENAGPTGVTVYKGNDEQTHNLCQRYMN
ncbi:hypothetical protein B0H17DRAFT_1136104 [Mycena rosella]|uniref:Uncharacterized protein n=1 Tax=Mycena rosella TaxID=1033263 RepID=A0AAD7DDB1_MYCRO|nr:hypothetical protein B0H17DRAFT_1136104 [Mycena rosella]